MQPILCQYGQPEPVYLHGPQLMNLETIPTHFTPSMMTRASLRPAVQAESKKKQVVFYSLRRQENSPCTKVGKGFQR